VGLASLPNTSRLIIADEEDRTVRISSSGGRVSNWLGASGISGFASGSGENTRLGSVEAIAYDPGIVLNLRSARLTAGSAWIKVKEIEGIHLGMTVSGTLAIPAGAQIEEIGAAEGFFRNIKLSTTATQTHAEVDLVATRASATYLADSVNHVICKVSMAGEMRVLCGSLGVAGDGGLYCSLDNAKFNAPQGVAVDPLDGTVYVSDTGNHAIRMIQQGVPRVYLVAGGTFGDTLALPSYSFKDVSREELGNGFSTFSPLDVKFYQPLGIAARTRLLTSLDFPLGRYVTEVFVADRMNHVVRVIRLNARKPDNSFAVLNWSGLSTDKSAYFKEGLYDKVLGVLTWAGQPGISGAKDGAGDGAKFNLPYGLALDFGNEVDGSLYVADQGNHALRRIATEFDAQTLVFKDQGTVETVAGILGVPGAADGSVVTDPVTQVQTAIPSRLSWPTGVAVNSRTGEVFVSDTGNFSIRVLRDGVLQAFVGEMGAKGSFNSAEVLDGFTYQWYKDGSPIAVKGSGLQGVNSDTLSNSPMAFSDIGAYQLEVRGATTLRSAVSLLRAETPMRFIESPLSYVQNNTLTNKGGVWNNDRGFEVDPYGTVRLTATVYGAGNLGYQWSKNGMPLSDGANLSGAVLSGVLSPSVTLGRGGWKKIDSAVAGPRHSAAISAGTLYMWGANDAGQLGLGDRVPRSLPQALPASAFGGNQVKEVALGQSHTLVRTADGAIYAWGSNAQGQLGKPSGDNILQPSNVDIGTKKIRAIAAGSNHCLAVIDKSSAGANTVLSWGGGPDTPAQLGRKIAAGKFVVASGAYSGELTGEIWSDAALAQAVFSMTVNTDSGVFSVPPRILSAAPASGASATNLVLDQKAQRSGVFAVTISHPAWKPSPVICTVNGQLRLLKAFDFSTESALLTKLKSDGKKLGLEAVSCVSTGLAHSLVLGDDLNVYGFGSNAKGQAGQVDTVQMQEVALAMPIETANIRGELFRSVAAGDVHSIALTSKGVLVSWGDNSSKQLGRSVIKSVESSLVSTNTLVVSGTSMLKVNSMAAYFEQNVGGGKWDARSGWSGKYDLGLNIWPQVFSPASARISVINASRVVRLDGFFSLPVPTMQGQPIEVVFADITNFSGMPRKAFYVESDPKQLSSIASGGSSNIAIGADSNVYVWGRNGGQLGIEWRDISELAAPQPLEFFSSVLGKNSRAVRVSVGGHGHDTGHAFAVDSQGMLFVWGDNTAGQLGDGLLAERRVPNYNAFSDFGNYTLKVRSSVDGQQDESEGVFLVQPEVEASRFGEWPRALLSPELQVSYKGSVAINIPGPMGYPKPDVQWVDGGTRSFGNSYVVNNVESLRQVSVTLGQRDGSGNFIPLPNPDLLSRWSFNNPAEPARLTGSFDYAFEYQLGSQTGLISGSTYQTTHAAATSAALALRPSDSSTSNLIVVPSVNPNYEPLESFRDAMLKQRSLRDQDSGNFSVRTDAGPAGTASFVDLSELDPSDATKVIAGSGTIKFSSGALAVGALKSGSLTTLTPDATRAASYVSLPMSLTGEEIARDGLTVEVWAALNNATAFPTIFSLDTPNKAGAELWAGYYYAKTDTSRPALSSSLADAATATATTAMPLVLGKIYHWALVVSPAAAKATLYRDGVEVCSVPVSLADVGALQFGELCLGKSLTNDDPHSSATYLEARVWRRTLSAAEIKQNSDLKEDADFSYSRNFKVVPSGFRLLVPDWERAGVRRRDSVVTVAQGDSIKLFAAFDGQPWPGMSYRWKKDGMFLNGENQSSLDFSNPMEELNLNRGIVPRQAGNYQVVVSDGFVIKESPVVKVVVTSTSAVTLTGNLTQDSDYVKVSNVSNLKVGMGIGASGIQKGTLIVEIIPATSTIRLSSLAFTTASNVTITASQDALYQVIVDSRDIDGNDGVRGVEIIPQLGAENSYLPAGTSVRITGTPVSGILRGWKITDPRNPDNEYGQVQATGSWVSFVTPAKDIKITPIIGTALAGLYSGFVTSSSSEEVTEQDLGKIRGYLEAAVTPQGSGSCALWVDGRRYVSRPTFGWVEGAKIDLSVVDKTSGVTVVEVLEGGIAEKAGLKASDIIESVQVEGSSTAIELYRVRDFDAFVNNSRMIGKKAYLSVVRAGVRLAEPLVVQPESEWYMRSMIQLDTKGLGIWVGEMSIKADEKRGTRAFLNLRNVSLKNPAFNSAEISGGNDIFCNAYTPVGIGKTNYGLHSAGLYKGTGKVENLGQGGVFLIQTNATAGTALIYGRLGNGKQFSFRGIVGRLFSPSTNLGSDFLSASASVANVFSETIVDETPEAAMRDALYRKTVNPLMPVWSLGDLRTDLNFIAGAVVFDGEKIHGSVGMINRPLNSTGFSTEYTPNKLVGHAVLPATTGTLGSAVWLPSDAVTLYSSLTYPKPQGFGSQYMKYFGTAGLILQKMTPELRVPNVENLRVERPLSGLFKGSFTATDVDSRLIGAQNRMSRGLINTFYGVAIGGETNAGVGFLLRGPVVQTYTQLLGNQQKFDEVSPRTESIRLDAP
jgi:alpha-tubulin suppressor-like RCC1 family protein